MNHPEPAPEPEILNQNPDGRDLRPESASHFCTFAQAVGRFALLHLGQHVVLSLPSIQLPRLPDLPTISAEPGLDLIPDSAELIQDL